MKTKYALVNEERREAEHGLSGKCPLCENPVIAKCGKIRVRHWAHFAKNNCDHWWENKTEWHEAWQNLFPSEWQEVVHRAENGEKHIADVKTPQNWVIEFQYSFLKPEERQVRNSFYQKVVWVVNGTRRKKDIPQFNDTISRGIRIIPNKHAYKVFPDENTLLKEWSDSDAPVFFDFGPGPFIWWLLPKGPNGKREFIGGFSRAEFIQLHLSGSAEQTQDFEAFLKEFSGLVSKYDSILQRRR
jgi:hypothetical protein